MQGTLTVIDEQVTEKILGELWRIGGFYIGLCDWRPGSPKSPGPFGRYNATLKKAK